MAELSRCRGCNGDPVDVGSFGRFLFACPRAARHSKNATKECDGGILRPSFYLRSMAVDEWNRLQGVASAAPPERGEG